MRAKNYKQPCSFTQISITEFSLKFQSTPDNAAAQIATDSPAPFYLAYHRHGIHERIMTLTCKLAPIMACGGSGTVGIALVKVYIYTKAKLVAIAQLFFLRVL